MLVTLTSLHPVRTAKPKAADIIPAEKAVKSLPDLKAEATK